MLRLAVFEAGIVWGGDDDGSELVRRGSWHGRLSGRDYRMRGRYPDRFTESASRLSRIPTLDNTNGLSLLLPPLPKPARHCQPRRRCPALTTPRLAGTGVGGETTCKGTCPIVPSYCYY